LAASFAEDDTAILSAFSYFTCGTARHDMIPGLTVD